MPKSCLMGQVDDDKMPASHDCQEQTLAGNRAQLGALLGLCGLLSVQSPHAAISMNTCELHASGG